MREYKRQTKQDGKCFKLSFHRVLSVFALCAAFSAPGAERASISVPAAEDKVIIDGKLSEDAWRRAAGAVLIPAKHPKEKHAEGGYFRVFYDSEALYLGGELEQSCLDQWANQLDKVKNKGLNDNDRNIYEDDCAEIFIQAPGAESYHHFALNSDGKLFNSTDKTFGDNTPVIDPEVKAAASKIDKSWSFELKIPWKSLGLKGEPGQKFCLKVYRSNAPKKELSGWTTVTVNFHDSDKWGDAVLIKESDGVRGIHFEAGKGGAVFSVSLPPGQYEFGGAINANPLTVKTGTRTRALQSKIDPGKDVSSVSVMRDGQVIWSSPALNGRSDMEKMSFALSGGECKLYINGGMVHEGKGAVRKEFALPGSLNITGVEFDGEKFDGTLNLGGVTVRPEDWLVTDKPGNDWLAEDYNPKEWKRYTGEKLEGKHFFRFTIIQGHLLFAPQNPDFTIYAANKTTHELRLRTMSPVPYALPDYEVVFEAPERLSVPLYDFENRAYNKDKHKFSDTVSDGVRRLSFKFEQPMPVRKYNFGCHVVNFMTKYDFPAAGDYPVTVYQKGFGVQEFPQTYTLRILPGLNPGRGKKINIGLADSGFVEKCLTPAEFKTVWETLAESGMNYILTDSYNGYQECCKFMRERNISTAWCQFMHHDATLKDIVAKHPESRHVNPVCPQPEWRLKSMMCPLAFMELPEVDAAHKELVTHFDWIMFDTENGVKSACLCERCRREFAKQFKLPETPDAKTIYEKYEKELLSFQIGMLRKVITFQMGLARKYNPEIKTSIYSGYAYPANMTAYGVDWSLYRDIDYPSAGYDLSSSIIAGTRKEIGGDPMICGFFPSTNLFENPRPDQNIKGRLFQLLRDGGFMGTFVFAWQEIDGRGLTALADFSRGCAAFGDMLMEKYQIPAENIVSGMSGDAVTAHKQNGKYLVLAVNLSPSPRKLRITPPDDLKNAAAWDFYKNTKTPVSGAFTAEVPANDASLILMEGK